MVLERWFIAKNKIKIFLEVINSKIRQQYLGIWKCSILIDSYFAPKLKPRRILFKKTRNIYGFLKMKVFAVFTFYKCIIIWQQSHQIHDFSSSVSPKYGFRDIRVSLFVILYFSLWSFVIFFIVYFRIFIIFTIFHSLLSLVLTITLIFIKIFI